MTTLSSDPGTATPPGDGAAPGQPSNTEVTELTAQLVAQTALVAARDTELETANSSISDLQTANKKFADDAVGLAGASEQLKEANTALEESRKTSTDLTAQLEIAKTNLAGMQDSMTTRRRKDLVSSGLPEDYVAGLDDAGLATLESALPHMPKTNGTPAPTGSGYGLDGGAATTNLADMSDHEKSKKLIESLKTPK